MNFAVLAFSEIHPPNILRHHDRGCASRGFSCALSSSVKGVFSRTGALDRLRASWRVWWRFYLRNPAGERRNDPTVLSVGFPLRLQLLPQRGIMRP
jgi:hypothetical protein